MLSNLCLNKLFIFSVLSNDLRQVLTVFDRLLYKLFHPGVM